MSSSGSSLRVKPLKISGNAAPVPCPPDKSVTHRSFLFSLFTAGTSLVRRPLLGQDCLASLEAVRRLGGKVQLKGDLVEISGHGIKPFAPSSTRENPIHIDCQNSGTTIRLLCGILAGQQGYFRLTGDDSLSQRPMGRVSAPLAQMGAAVYARGTKKGARTPTPTPPVEIEPAPSLKAIAYESNVASAQVKSAVLLAGLSCREGRTSVTEPALSRDHTERMLREMGIEVQAESLGDGRARASLSGAAGRALKPLDMTVGGDPSSAAFWACAAVMQNKRVRINNVLLNSTRLGFGQVLKRMGADISWNVESVAGGEEVGTVEVRGTGSFRATEVLPPEIPTLVDEVPMLAICSLWAKGTTIFRGVQELRVKESDRLEAIIQFIGSLGGRARAEENDLFVEGLSGAPRGPGQGEWFYETLGDHRLAMAAVITADALHREIVLDDAECIKVSYPGFFEHREALSK